MAGSSGYGSSSGGSGYSSSAATWKVPSGGKYSAASKPHGHGLLGNLLSDAVTMAKGIVPGMIMTVEHPIRTAKAFGESYSKEYSPLIHGHFGQFYKEVHAHPLQPLLDAVSIPLIVAGGAGLGIKTASFGAELGAAARSEEVLGAVSAARRAGDFAKADELMAQSAAHPGLYKAAERFRSGTAYTTKSYGHLAAPGMQPENLVHHFSTNLFRRGLQRGAMSIFENKVGKVVPFFSETGKAERLFAQTMSKRASAASGRAFGQVGALKAAGKSGEVSPAEAGMALNRDFEKHLVDTAMPFDRATAEHLSPTGKLTRHMQYIAADSFKTKYSGTIVDPENPRIVPHDLQDFSHEGITKFVKGMGGRIKTTRDPNKAMVFPGDTLRAVRDGDVKAQLDNIESSASLMHQIYFAPLKVWKAFILGQSPRYFVNNVIGNIGMYTTATNPVEMTRGVLAAVRSVHGVHAATAMEKQMGTTMDGIMAKFLPDEFVHTHFGYLQHGSLSLGQTVENRLGTAFKRRANLYHATEKVAYRGPQRASIMGAVSTMPEFRTWMRHFKASGQDDYTAFQNAARKVIADPRKAGAVEKRVTDWAGQYYHLNSLERNMTALVPFYNWTRHALRYGKEMTLQRPVMTATMAQLGALGDKQTTKELGNLPDFIKGAIPVGGHVGGILGMILGQQAVGRKNIILSAGYNPMAAAADDARAIAALVGGGNPREAIGGQLNPVVSGIIAGVTGQQLFSGAKSGYGSPLQGALEEPATSLPHVKAIQALLAAHGIGKPRPTKTKKGEPTLYKGDMRQIITSWLGLNERQFSPKAAEKLYRTQEGIKKGKRHANKRGIAAARKLGSYSSGSTSGY